MFIWENKQIWHLWLNKSLFYLNVLSASRSYPLKYRNAQSNVLSINNWIKTDIWVKWLIIIILLNDSYLCVAIFFLIWDNLGQHQDKWIFLATCPTDKLFSNPAPNTGAHMKPSQWGQVKWVLWPLRDNHCYPSLAVKIFITVPQAQLIYNIVGWWISNQCSHFYPEICKNNSNKMWLFSTWKFYQEVENNRIYPWSNH